jgi:hypothetical protein
MIDLLPTFLPYLSIVVALVVTIGGIFAFRQGYSRMAITVREDVISALNSQIDTLKDQVVALEKEIERQKVIVSTIRYALKQRGLYIRVNGDIITMVDRGKPSTTQMTMGQKTRDEEENGNDDENGDDTTPHKAVK